MDNAMDALLREYEARSANEDVIMAGLSERQQMLDRRDEFLLPVGRHTGTLLSILVTESQATRVLEIGTSYGYSTVWLADAVRTTGGRVTSLDLQPEKQAFARQQLARVGLDGFVDFRAGDALDSIAALPGPFDFVLLDCWKDVYIRCFDAFHPKLSPGAIVVADNMRHPEVTRAEADKYRAHVRRFTDVSSVLLPVGSGIEVSRKG